ncbi:TPA: phage tail assembly chaperone, partial [Escherichia coli]
MYSDSGRSRRIRGWGIMKKDLKMLALARLSGFRHKTVKVPEWG